MSKTVTNQKLIKVNINVKFPKEKTKAEKNEIYGKVNKKCTSKAMLELTPSAFKIYMYIALQENGWSFGLSPANIEKNTGVGRTAYHEAIKLLIAKNYLIEMNNTCYMFVVDNDMQKVTEIRNQIEKRKEILEIQKEAHENSLSTIIQQTDTEASDGKRDRKITYINKTNINITEEDVLFADTVSLKKYLVSIDICDEAFEPVIGFDTRIADIITVHPEDFAGIYEMCKKNIKFKEIYLKYPQIKGNIVYAINCISRQIDEFYRTHLRVEEQIEIEKKEMRSKAYRHAQINEYYNDKGDYDVERAYAELFEENSMDVKKLEGVECTEKRIAEEENKYSMFEGLTWDDTDEAV